jgi:DNA-directed RNA polymerase specialized sigma24 family protein
VRCQAGDRAAFEELVELYQPRLRYFLASMVGDDHAADDLLHRPAPESPRTAAGLTPASP